MCPQYYKYVKVFCEVMIQALVFHNTFFTVTFQNQSEFWVFFYLDHWISLGWYSDCCASFPVIARCKAVPSSHPSFTSFVFPKEVKTCDVNREKYSLLYRNGVEPPKKWVEGLAAESSSNRKRLDGILNVFCSV